MTKEIIIISVGGAVIVPDSIDTAFLKKFCKLIKEKIKTKRFVLVTGGGKTSRNYIEAVKKNISAEKEDLDWLGIQATRMNAFLLKMFLKDISHPNIIENPEKEISFDKDVLVAGGWKPGFSTDYCAVKLAKNLGSSMIINLTDTDYVYDRDPRKYPDAKPIESLTWQGIKKLVGEEWEPGMHAPFDPIASAEAQKLGLRVIILGKDIENLRRCIEGKKFKGTTIS